MNLFLILMFKKPVSFFSKTFLWINFSFSQFHEHIFKSSRSHLFVKIGVLKSFPDFTEKHWCWSLFKNLAGWRPANLLKKSFPGKRCFPVKFTKFLRTHFFNISGDCFCTSASCFCIFLKKLIKQLLLFCNLFMMY